MEPVHGRSWGRAIVALVAVLLIVTGAAIYAVVLVAPGSRSTTTMTRYFVGADDVVTSAAGQSPAGYTLESSKGNPGASSDWAVLGQVGGSTANITALAFGSQNESQSYFVRLVLALKGLPGYTNVTSALSSFRQFGNCYGYGEDVDGIAVVNGICTKGNLFLQVHLVSGKSFDDLESDMMSVMGALYDSVG